MKRAAAALLLIMAGTSISAYSPPPVQTFSPPGVPVDLFFRSLQPGEVILAKLKDEPSVQRVTLRWFDQIRILEFPKKDAGGAPFVLLGIDLYTKPASYPLEIAVEHPDRSAQASSQSLAVELKEFPSTNLRVATSMALPPPGEQELIRRESELVSEILSLVSPEWLAEGSFQSPLPDHEPYPNFGQRRIYNRSSTSIHAGTDIAAPWGTPTLASNGGRIVFAGRLYLSGYTVIIDHGRGVFTYYCHFSKLLVKRGDLVKRGQAIANIGSTGRSTGPHLHWSARILNARVDPFALLSLPL